MESLTDRRGHTRGSMFSQRRRYPRIIVPADVYYESDERALVCDRAELSLRGLFVPCRAFDAEGTRGLVRIDTGPGPLVTCRIEVIRSADPARLGMALRYVDVGELGLSRIGKLLIHVAGLPAIPQLERRFELLARIPVAFARLAA
jgi:hypothetical protein